MERRFLIERRAPTTFLFLVFFLYNYYQYQSFPCSRFYLGLAFSGDTDRLMTGWHRGSNNTGQARLTWRHAGSKLSAGSCVFFSRKGKGSSFLGQTGQSNTTTAICQPTQNLNGPIVYRAAHKAGWVEPANFHGSLRKAGALLDCKCIILSTIDNIALSGFRKYW